MNGTSTMNKKVPRLFLAFRKTLFYSLILCCYSLLFLPSLAAQTIFVNASATGSNNGSSWANAYTDLQDAIASATNTGADIWVAAGTYKPSVGVDIDGNGTTENRERVFAAFNGMTLIGGFPNTGNPTLANRNRDANPTILDGDIGTVGNNSDNAYHVVYYNQFDFSAPILPLLIEGFYIENGNANGASGFHQNGGGMSIRDAEGTARVKDCYFRNNFATSSGGGLRMVSVFGSTPIVSSSVFDNNTALQNGGGAEVAGAIHCLFMNNTSALAGGAGIVDFADNCVFVSNVATSSGGGLGLGSAATRVNNCTVANNTAPAGSGISSFSTGPIPVTNTVIWNNTGSPNSTGGLLDMSYSLIQENTCPSGVTCGSGMIFNQNPSFVNLANDDLRLQSSSIAINAGNNSFVVEPQDIDGITRILSGTVDMGAYESIGTQGSTSSSATQFIFVNESATGANNGTSWANAFTDLQDAIAVATNTGAEIWVAAGTYKPSVGVDIDGNGTTENRERVFAAFNGMSLIGGFPNTGNPTLADRNRDANPTILDGDIGTVGNNSDNAYHVIYYNQFDFSAPILPLLIDGFYIENGNANGSSGFHQNGGGMSIRDATGTARVNDCYFRNNFATSSGGGLRMVSVFGSTPIVSSSVFENNTALQNGGGAEVAGAIHCLFINNTSALAGGAGIVDFADNCVFVSNVATSSGGGLGLGSAATRVNNCTVANNTAPAGSGISSFSTGPIPVTNTIIWNNTGSSSSTGGLLDMSYSLIQENTCPSGVTCGSGMIFNQNPSFVNLANDDLRLQSSSIAINAGNNSFVVESQDIDGTTRILFGTVDMGAYESLVPQASTFYADTDNDGFGDPNNTTQASSQPPGFVTDNTDCDDNDANEFPGQVWYLDTDGDGYGNGNSVVSCNRPNNRFTAAELIATSGDCDNNDANEFPGQVWYLDADGDDYSNGNSIVTCNRPNNRFTAAELIATSGDCNDNNGAINPGATEVCDGLDNDCDGSIDEGGTQTFYADNDGDGFGNPSNATQACSQPAGFVTNNNDCDDNDANEFPGQRWYLDVDGDDYSNGNSIVTCNRPNNRFTAAELIATSGDCNDNNAAINPGATEICDGLDNDCDGSIDEGLTTTFYADNDGDGFGNPSNATQACSQPAGFVTNNNDCDDNDANEFPGQRWYLDVDGDDYSNGNSIVTCNRPNNRFTAAELIATSGDCNDNNAAINPGATEICDGLDNDCDGSIDEGLTTTFYADNDGDGFGNPSTATQACSQPAGFVTNNTDCDDNDDE